MSGQVNEKGVNIYILKRRMKWNVNRSPSWGRGVFDTDSELPTTVVLDTESEIWTFKNMILHGPISQSLSSLDGKLKEKKIQFPRARSMNWAVTVWRCMKRWEPYFDVFPLQHELYNIGDGLFDVCW